jgi:hypothetical protein
VLNVPMDAMLLYWCSFLFHIIMLCHGPGSHSHDVTARTHSVSESGVDG